MLGPLDIHRELLAVNAAHEIVRLPRTLAAADELPEVLGLPAAACVSVSFYETNVGLVGVLAPAGTAVQPALLAKAVGARTLRAADPGAVNAATDYVAALAGPVCLPPTLPLYADLRLARADVLYTATGDSGTALKMRTAELLALTGARLARLAGPVRVPTPAADAADAGATPAEERVATAEPVAG
ncbi:MAG: aminoacyl-tRNA deacylase [Mycobacteriales bacterium]|nr:YbaK/EbsC family protein [Frankia sp.]